MDTAILPVIDWSPFKEEEVNQLGLVRNWAQLVRILGPLTSPDFSVTDATSQALIDRARFTLDLSFGSFPNDEVERNIVEKAASVLPEENPAQVFEVLLAIGVDPDLSNTHSWRASHTCGCSGHVEAASVLFPCRPDMTATNENGDTPLQAAEKKKYKNDDKYPERKTLRQYVAKFIKDGGFETRFPTLVELAAQRKWVPMKNLLRRQVVKQAEFVEVLSGRTAAGWAEFFKETMLAKEIRYYEQPASVRIRAAASLFLHVSRENSSLGAKLKEEEERNAELSETVNVLSSKLEGRKEEDEDGAARSAKKARSSPSDGGKDKNA